MPTEKTIKLSETVHKRLLQFKIANDCKSIDQAIEQLLKRPHD